LHQQSREGEKQVSFSRKSIKNVALHKKIEQVFVKYKDYRAPAVVGMWGFTLRDVLVSNEGEIFFVDPGKVGKKYCMRG